MQWQQQRKERRRIIDPLLPEETILFSVCELGQLLFLPQQIILRQITTLSLFKTPASSSYFSFCGRTKEGVGGILRLANKIKWSLSTGFLRLVMQFSDARQTGHGTKGGGKV
jgi:hypothetical protein